MTKHIPRDHCLSSIKLTTVSLNRKVATLVYTHLTVNYSLNNTQ